MVKCWCCSGGSWTWEEDWHWCLERLSVRGNSERRKTETLHFQSQMCVCVCVKRERQSWFTRWILYSPLTSPRLWWSKGYCGGWKGGRDKERAGSICRLPVMPSQLKAGRQTRPDQTLTQRGSAVPSLTITRQQLKKHTPTPTALSGWRAEKELKCSLCLAIHN